MREIITNGYGLGVHSLLEPELIPQQAAQDSSNWASTDGLIELGRGRLLTGARETGTGGVKGIHVGYKADGTAVLFRKINTKIQYKLLTDTTWTNVVTGLTASNEYTFSNYTSLAGAMVFATGGDGIYKIMTANPGSYVSMYDSTKNFKGYSIIDTGRMFMWNLSNDKTGLYGSYIDAQNSVVYTTVTGEATTSLTGTLNAKGGVFTVTIASPAVFTRTAHGFAAGDALSFSTTGALPTGLLPIGLSNPVYWVIAAGLTANEFQVSTTKGGSAVNTTGSQSGVHTIVDQRRTVFGVTITLTGTGEVYTDNYNGILTGSLGGTGTINYTTGAYTVSNAGVGTASYQWEMTNNKGVTDFTKSATRLAGEGFMFRQDAGGDAILNVLVQDGKYYSIKSRSVYELNLTNTDTNATNLVFRKDIGMPYWRACVATGSGMVMLDTSNPSQPKLTILQRNITGDNLEPAYLAPQFDFSEYVWDMCAMDTFGENIVFSGRTSDNAVNNRFFIFNKRRNSVDVFNYSVKVITKNAGILYTGDSLSDNVYETLSGFDDDGFSIDNYWTGKTDNLGMENLKKFKWLPIKGLITPNQTLQIWISYDNQAFSLIGTVVGSGIYVDRTNPITIGSSGIGINEIGGGGTGDTGYEFFTSLKVNTQKFRTRTIKYVATGVGYVAVQMQKDSNIMVFATKLPSKYRIKQNVSLAGTASDQ